MFECRCVIVLLQERLRTTVSCALQVNFGLEELITFASKISWELLLRVSTLKDATAVLY